MAMQLVQVLNTDRLRPLLEMFRQNRSAMGHSTSISSGKATDRWHHPVGFRLSTLWGKDRVHQSFFKLLLQQMQNIPMAMQVMQMLNTDRY